MFDCQRLDPYTCPQSHLPSENLRKKPEAKSHDPEHPPENAWFPPIFIEFDLKILVMGHFIAHSRYEVPVVVGIFPCYLKFIDILGHQFEGM